MASVQRTLDTVRLAKHCTAKAYLEPELDTEPDRAVVAVELKVLNRHQLWMGL